MNLNNLLIELSHNCNLNCIMCGYGTGIIDPKKFMSLDLFYYVMEKIGHKAKNIRLNGRGESTIHPNFIEILDFFKINYPSISLSLFSNLSFNNDKIIKALLNKNIELFISFDSPVKETLLTIRRNSNYDRIISNIHKLSEKSSRPFIVFTLQELNWLSITDIADFSIKNNLNLIYNVVRRDEGMDDFISIISNNKNQIQQAFDKVRKDFIAAKLICKIPHQIAGINLNATQLGKSNSSTNKCELIEKELCICYDGEILPCNMFNTYSYGHIEQLTIPEIKQKIQDFSKIQTKHYYCINCAYLGSDK